MGTRTDCEIADFREEAGITPETGKEEATKLLHAAGVKPATGKRKRLLEQIIEVATGRTECGGTIDCLKMELSGERDGDGYWHGGDPVSASIEDLIRVCQEWLDWEKKVRNARHVLEENENESVRKFIPVDDDLPF